MNTPTTLFTALLSTIPALIAPAQACPYCRKAEPPDPIIDWRNDVPVRGSKHFVQLLQPLVSGKVRAQVNDDEMPLIAFMGTEADEVSVSAPCGAFLCIYLPDNREQDAIPRIMRGLHRLTDKGKLRTVRLSELEQILSEEVEYEPVTWKNVTIVAPEPLQEAGKALAEQLGSVVVGSVSMETEPSAESAAIVTLNIHHAPTQATAVAKDNCIQLNINHQDSSSVAVERFMKVLRHIAEEDGGTLQSVSEKRLNTAFHETYRAHNIDWQHIAIPAELGDEVADWFRQYTNAKVELYDDDTPIHYTPHTVLVKMRYGGNRESNRTLMSLAADIIPTLHLSIAQKQKASKLTDTQYRQAVALRLLEWLRPLMQNDKLPPITVKELQQHLHKTKHPIQQP